MRICITEEAPKQLQAATLLKTSKFRSQFFTCYVSFGKGKPHKDLMEVPEPVSILSAEFPLSFSEGMFIDLAHKGLKWMTTAPQISVKHESRPRWRELHNIW